LFLRVERSVPVLLQKLWKRNANASSYVNCMRNHSISSAETVHQQPLPNKSDKPWSENDYVNPKIENRNPRNLEKMALALKQKGFKLDSPTEHYYHKLILEKGTPHTTAYIQHCSGEIVLSASTKEWAIRKYLYSGNDVSAAKNIGKIIAQRCLESGILHVHASFNQEEQISESVTEFLKEVEKGGLSLEEPMRIYPLRPWD